MKKLAYTVGGKQLVITLDEKRGSIRAIEANGKPLEPTAEEMPIIAGVISLALLTYETEVVHDEETVPIPEEPPPKPKRTRKKKTDSVWIS